MPGQSQGNQDGLVTLGPDLHRPLFLDTQHGLLAVPLMSLQCPLGPPPHLCPSALSKIKLGCTCPCLKPLCHFPFSTAEGQRNFIVAWRRFSSAPSTTPAGHLQALYPYLARGSVLTDTRLCLCSCCAWPETRSQLSLPHLFVAPSNCNLGAVSPRTPS